MGENKEKYFVHGIIAGHGGLKDGIYTTCPNFDIDNPKTWRKMHVFNKDSIFYEGVENRKIRDEVIKLGKEKGFSFVDVLKFAGYEDHEDVPLLDRAKAISLLKAKVYEKGKRLIVWEIHHNAFNGKAEGVEIFTTPGENFSDKMATCWWNSNKKFFPEQVKRTDESDNDPDKEANFALIKHSPSFICLPELYFFDNPKEVKKYWNQESRIKRAEVFIDAARKIEENYAK